MFCAAQREPGRAGRGRGRDTGAAKREGKGQIWMRHTGCGAVDEIQWMKFSVAIGWHLGQSRSTLAGLNLFHLPAEAGCSVPATDPVHKFKTI